MLKIISPSITLVTKVIEHIPK